MISGPDDEVTEEEQMKPTDTVKLSKFLTRAGQVRATFNYVQSLLRKTAI